MSDDRSFKLNQNPIVHYARVRYLPPMTELQSLANVDAHGCEPTPPRELAAESKPRHSPVEEMDQLVSAQRLLEIIWDAKSRPSLKWLRRQVKCRMIPYVKRGRLYFFRPKSVLEWFRQKECLPASMKPIMQNNEGVVSE